MTVFFGQQMTKLRVDPRTPPAPGFVDGTVRCFVEEVTLAAQTTADTIEVARLPKGAIPLYGVLSNTVTLGATAQIAIGITGTTGKYRAAAVKTTVTPEVFGVSAGLGEALADEEIVFITISVASLAASGTLRVMLVYAFN